jgi:TusA-related sulfurtransferase
MTEHEKQSVDIAKIFGYEPNEVYGDPVAKETRLEGFQEQVPTVEELLADLPEVDEGMGDGEVPVEGAEEEVEDAKLVDQLKAIVDDEEADADIKKTAEELMARLEELSAAEENAKAFLAENKPAVEEPVEEGGEEPPAVEI